MTENNNEKQRVLRIKNPNELGTYLRVTNPGTWLILIGIFAVIVGFIIWAASGNIETVEKLNATVKSGNMRIFSTGAEKNPIKVGMTVRYEDDETNINSTETDDFGRIIATADSTLPDGEYKVLVVVEKIRPIDYLIKKEQD